MHRRNTPLAAWERDALDRYARMRIETDVRQLIMVWQGERLAERARFLTQSGLLQRPLAPAERRFPAHTAPSPALLEYRLYRLFAE